MKRADQWKEEAALEIEGYANAGEELTYNALLDEITALYQVPDLREVICNEGGLLEYVDTLWSYIEKELEA